jgi:hypothetical protein
VAGIDASIVVHVALSVLIRFSVSVSVAVIVIKLVQGRSFIGSSDYKYECKHGHGVRLSLFLKDRRLRIMF